MEIWLPLAIGAGVGLAKNVLSDQPEYERQKSLAAATARFSPWTGLKPQMPKAPNAFGDIISGGMTGLMAGQGLEKLAGGNLFGSAATGAVNTAAENVGKAATEGTIWDWFK